MNGSLKLSNFMSQVDNDRDVLGNFPSKMEVVLTSRNLLYFQTQILLEKSNKTNFININPSSLTLFSIYLGQANILFILRYIFSEGFSYFYTYLLRYCYRSFIKCVQHKLTFVVKPRRKLMQQKDTAWLDFTHISHKLSFISYQSLDIVHETSFIKYFS